MHTAQSNKTRREKTLIFCSSVQTEFLLQHFGIMLFCLVLPWKEVITPELLARLSGGYPTLHHCHSQLSPVPAG